MACAWFVTHPDVVMDPNVPVPRWPLSERGRRRMAAALEQPWARALRHVYSSDEQKAFDGAAILCEGLGLPHTVLPELGEIDRSSTGFLPPDEHWALVEAFFARPDESASGWERARDAQARIAAAFEDVLQRAPAGDDVAIVSHGTVGTLLLCRLAGRPISLAEEQPRPGPEAPKGAGGGHFFGYDRAARALVHGWRAIDAV